MLSCLFIKEIYANDDNDDDDDEYKFSPWLRPLDEQ